MRWEAPRRLSQLRGELHNRIKFSMEANEYRALFDDTPFAHSGGDLAVGDNKTRGRLFYPTAVVTERKIFGHMWTPENRLPQSPAYLRRIGQELRIATCAAQGQAEQQLVCATGCVV